MTSARITNGALAIWLGVSAFLGFSATGNILNAVTVGSFVAGAGFALAQDSRLQGRIAAILGIWLILAALLPSLQTGAGLLWNNLIVSLGLLSASIPYRRPDSLNPTTAATELSRGSAGRVVRSRAATRPAGQHGRELAHHH